MLKEGMLTEREAEQYWKDHPDERPNETKQLTEAYELPIQESVMMEFDHNSEKIPVKNINFDKVYFGSPKKYSRGIRTDRPLFVTPFMGIASIFIYGDLDIQNKVPRGSYNIQYEEWNTASDEEMSKPFKEVHVYVEGYPELEPYEIENTGYIHTVNASKYKNDFYRYEWMSDKIEYLIDTDDSFVDVTSVQEVTVHYYVSGKATNNPKLGPYKKNDQAIKESYITFPMLERYVPHSSEGLPDGVWMRPAMKGDTEYIFNVEWDTLDDKWKDDPKVLDMFKKDARESVPRTRIICYTDERNNSQTIGLLQAYQKDDYWYIGEIWLKPEFRGKGYGKAILENEISKHDWLSLDVSKKNKHAIDLYLDLGFKIVSENDDAYRMDLKKNSNTIQEGAWNDIKNGVNPFSNKLVFHVSTEGHYDGQVFKPRVPEYLTKSDENETHFEDTENPRVCFSPSIEGALNAIIVNLGYGNQARQLKDLYVYVPEKPLSEYKHKTTKQLIDEKKVFDANITKEIWIEEPVRLREYGVIRVDQVSNYSVKKTVPNKKGDYAERYKHSFKWHWLVKPKLFKERPFDYSPKRVVTLLSYDLAKFKYGLIKDGRLVTDTTESDYDKYWKLSPPETFDDLGGGNCFDYTEWSAGYLDAYGVKCKKYFMDFGHNYHTFVVVKTDKVFTVVDGTLKRFDSKSQIIRECKSLNDCFEYIIHNIKQKDKSVKTPKIYDYTNEKIDYGTPMKEYINWIKSHGKEIKYNKQIKEVYSMDNFERDPSVLKMIMEEDVFNENISTDDSIQEAATQQFITGFKALRFYLETILKKLGYQVTNDNYQPLVFKVKKDSLTTTIDGSDGKGCKIITRDLYFNVYSNANGMSLSTARQVLPGFFKDEKQARREPIHVSKYLNESADETNDDGENMNDASLDINIDADGDGDAIDIGIDTCPTQNQYDPKEIEELNKLISSEADAISDYFTGSKETRIPVLSKLYSDIGEEERFHLEQLLYAKSTITGEKYEPRDPKVRSEYEELLELGMDEETAMTTAVDKLSISVSVPDDEMTEQEEEELKESFDMLLSLSKFVSLTVEPMLETVINENEIKDNLFNEYTNIIEEMYVMEEVDNLNRKSSSVDLGSGNPIKMVLSAFRSIYKIIIAIVKRAKTAFLKVRLKDKRRWAWLKKHGIKGLFQKGVYLYFYSDKRNKYEVGQALTFIEIINQMNNKIVQQCKLNINTSKYNIDGYLRKLSDIEKAPIDKASILQRIKGASLEDGMRDLQGMVLQKTKLVVTDANEAYLEELFFGYTDKKYNVIMNDQEGNAKNVDISMNIYNQLDIALSALEITGNETNVILEELEKLEGQGGIYAEKPKVYNSAVRAASQMVKSIQKFVNAMTSDIKTIFDLNRGLKEIVDKIESVDSTKEEKAEGRKELKDYNDANQERKEEARKAVDERDNKNTTTTKIRV
jgi:ribosomal protein S18 acetylase RimI-like enzyme